LTWLKTAASFVVPEITAIFLPAICSKESTPDVFTTRRPVLSTKTGFEKSTSFMRPSVIVLDPHSMSAFPFATTEKRSCTETGTHSIVSGTSPS